MRPVPEHDPKSWLLKALRETANALESLLWGIDEDLVAGRPDEDEWSSAELMRHMVEMERCYVDRLERMVNLDEPHIRAFDADSLEDARRPDAAHQRSRRAIPVIGTNRTGSTFSSAYPRAVRVITNRS